jgi:hypothetical protein
MPLELAALRERGEIQLTASPRPAWRARRRSPDALRTMPQRLERPVGYIATFRYGSAFGC